MFLSRLNLYDFRKFNSVGSKPGISVLFNENLNIIIGENDSGKTAIIDALKLLLGTSSDDYEKIRVEDFSRNDDGLFVEKFVIEGIFSKLNEKEAGIFLEWLSFNDSKEYELRVVMEVERKTSENGNEYFDKRLMAGEKNCELRFNGNARAILKATYLKPLRDANIELKSGVKSRLANILKAHILFKEEGATQLTNIMEEANEKIEGFFETEYSPGKSITNDIENILKNFYDETDKNKAKSTFTISRGDLTSILRKLSLDNEELNLGLGNQNLLFMATEFLLLNEIVDDRNIIGPHLILIEEIEAHLHTQAQIRLVKYLEDTFIKGEISRQLILTTHSSDLVASINPESILMIHKNTCYPMSREYTSLDSEDYKFLERFLDATKSNLFFAKGIIFVEGESEMLLLPTLAEIIGLPLHKYGVSVVNVHGTSFERYLKLFSRSEVWNELFDNRYIEMPISIITDLDVKPYVYYETNPKDIFSIKTFERLDQMCNILEIVLDDFLMEDLEIEFSTLNQLAKNYNFKVPVDKKEELETILKLQITEEFIRQTIDSKRTSISEKYSIYNSNHQIFITPEWTLEYSIAKSKLFIELFTSIHNLRYQKPFEGKYLKIFNDYKEHLESLESIDDFTALEIFSPVLNKLVSKAELAQDFSLLILKKFTHEKEDMKTKLLEDHYFFYLVSAILHATKKSIDDIRVIDSSEEGSKQ